MDNFCSVSPKRNKRLQSGWEGFFPYYAGYPEAFARDILEKMALSQPSIIYDPWNGSGTTTYSAGQLGHKAIGIDINPVMIVVSKARMLSPKEADSLEPLCKKIIESAKSSPCLSDSDPLLLWMTPRAGLTVRNLERSLASHLIGPLTLAKPAPDLNYISSIACAFYVALFSVCRDLCKPFQSSNPTWFRKPKSNVELADADPEMVCRSFQEKIIDMSRALLLKANTPDTAAGNEIKLGDSTQFAPAENSIDLVLTSPPYCTRIDYASATRIELALLEYLVKTDYSQLGKSMIGSTRSPGRDIEIEDKWGRECKNFVEKVRAHPSKASSGYYLNTHLDYFWKMARSLENISSSLKECGKAILVVQDSYYKEVHNDLPKIITEMAENASLTLEARQDFSASRSMSQINPHSRNYGDKSAPIESVLYFTKS